MAEFFLDPSSGVQILNDTDIDSGEVFLALAEQNPEAAALVRWSADTQLPPTRRGSLFDRDRYVSPEKVFDQMRVAYHAAETDDVVSGVVEGTEALAFSKMSIDTEEDDETDVWNQIAEGLDLDRRLREMWREDFTISQFVSAVWWGTRDFRVRGKSDAGISRKKTFTGLRVPIGLTILDPLKVVPVGNLLFNQERMAYWADNVSEYDLINAVIDGRAPKDPVISQLMVGEEGGRLEAEAPPSCACHSFG